MESGGAARGSDKGDSCLRVLWDVKECPSMLMPTGNFCVDVLETKGRWEAERSKGDSFGGI